MSAVEVGVLCRKELTPEVSSLLSTLESHDLSKNTVLASTERPSGRVPSGVFQHTISSSFAVPLGKHMTKLLEVLSHRDSDWYIIFDSITHPDPGFFEFLSNSVPASKPTYYSPKIQNKVGERARDVLVVRTDNHTSAVVPYENSDSPTFRNRMFLGSHVNIFNKSGIHLALSIGGYPKFNVEPSKPFSFRFREKGGKISLIPDISCTLTEMRPPVSFYDDWYTK